ncbi:histidinol-phosphatase [Rhodothermus bifroesti]|uniref:Histidinol-phosphatase n=1 Tax=Rhodothermus marinus TaxID=29549 RepID=A0A7V2AZ80_RHOMR|nr:histidinol-phosphatase [Rhodothermus bifroesti]GBD01804.1 Histidinol-phosphatase [bacterium HR18]
MNQAFFRRLADIAAETLRPYWGQQLAVELKEDASPVTEADRAVERALRAQITQAYPAHGLWGEEYGPERPDAEWVWVLDPIDGTKSFIAGVPLFTTLIGLLHEGRPVQGAIIQPVLGQFLYGDGTGAWFNNKPVRVRQCMRLEEAVLLTTDENHIEQHYGSAAFTQLRRRVRLFRTWGDAYGYLLVATGRADIMLDAEMHPWDVLPLIPVVTGAGGMITSWYGGDAPQGPGCVAAAPTLHAEVLGILRAATT